MLICHFLNIPQVPRLSFVWPEPLCKIIYGLVESVGHHLLASVFVLKCLYQAIVRPSLSVYGPLCDLSIEEHLRLAVRKYATPYANIFYLLLVHVTNDTEFPCLEDRSTD